MYFPTCFLYLSAFSLYESIMFCIRDDSVVSASIRYVIMSFISGTETSAAADGVGALKSATKSEIDKSVS